MPNWTREKPTKHGKYWYRDSPDAVSKLGYIDPERDIYRCDGLSCRLSDMRGWWAEVMPPPFDGEVGE